MSYVFNGSRILAPISSQHSGNSSSRHTEITCSMVGLHFSSRASTFRNCQNIFVSSCSGEISSEADFLFFFKVVSIADYFRFNSAVKQIYDTFQSPHIVSTHSGVGNLRHKWYVDGIACMEFSEGVAVIAFSDVGRSMTKNSTTLVMLLALTSRLIAKGHGSFP